MIGCRRSVGVDILVFECDLPAALSTGAVDFKSLTYRRRENRLTVLLAIDVGLCMRRTAMIGVGVRHGRVLSPPGCNPGRKDKER